MKSHLDLPALHPNLQNDIEINPRLINIFKKPKATITFYKIPFVAIVSRIVFILSVTLIGQLFFSLIKLTASLWV
ncbi:MAG: hypothetical protein PHD43_11685 [Methylococcales bacterium]|nr:hypothetical protein [Methylococcales bacterium]